MILREIAKRLSCTLDGDGDVEITGISTLESAHSGDLSFLTNPRYKAAAQKTSASALIVSRDCPPLGPSLLRSDNPYLTFALALELFFPKKPSSSGVHPTAIVAGSARLGAGVSIGALSYVGEEVIVGSGTQIGVRCVIEDRVRLGEHCIVHSGCVVREQVQIGRGCVLQSNCVIGSDGFGYAKKEDGAWHRIPQTGTVVLEDEVDVGACVAIDRATLGETRIRRGTKIDNSVHIGHGCDVGPDNLICAQVGLAGSTRTGAQVILAGQVGAAGHLTIGDGVIATAQTGIPSSVEAGRHISGAPAVDHAVWLKSSAAYARLPELARIVRALERRMSALEVDKEGATSHKSSNINNGGDLISGED